MGWCDMSRVSDLEFNAVDEAPLWMGNNGCDEGQWNSTNVTGRIVVVDQTGYSEVCVFVCVCLCGVVCVCMLKNWV